jgi:tRNA pseudouridine13 synthase
MTHFPIPLLTASLPGVGGRIKVHPEDFEVDEVPSYEPSGEGEHLFLWIEKRSVGPEFLTRMIAQRLGVPVGTIGTAGLKDRHAVTRQWVSVPQEAEPRLKRIDGDGIRVLNVSRHANKLKPGHLRGNRFRILIRDADTRHADDAMRIVEQLQTEGMPNFYGPQRFGRENSTLELGWRCLAGTASKRIRPFLFKFALSAVQSFLFNDYLSRRMHDGLLRVVLPGDVMLKWPFGGLFVVEDLAQEQKRFDEREIIMGGPMFGSRTFAAGGLAATREQAILQDHQIGPATFARFGKLATGTRRHNLVYLDDLTANWEPDGLRLTFTLPAGSYATVLLHEVMKTNPDAVEDDDDGNEN